MKIPITVHIYKTLFLSDGSHVFFPSWIKFTIIVSPHSSCDGILMESYTSKATHIRGGCGHTVHGSPKTQKGFAVRLLFYKRIRPLDQADFVTAIQSSSPQLFLNISYNDNKIQHPMSRVSGSVQSWILQDRHFWRADTSVGPHGLSSSLEYSDNTSQPVTLCSSIGTLGTKCRTLTIADSTDTQEEMKSRRPL